MLWVLFVLLATQKTLNSINIKLIELWISTLHGLDRIFYLLLIYLVVKELRLKANPLAV